MQAANKRATPQPIVYFRIALTRGGVRKNRLSIRPRRRRKVPQSLHSTRNGHQSPAESGGCASRFRDDRPKGRSTKARKDENTKWKQIGSTPASSLLPISC